MLDELYKRGEIENKQQYGNAFDKIQTEKMELPSEFLKQIPFITRTKLEKHMLIVTDKPTQEEHLS